MIYTQPARCGFRAREVPRANDLQSHIIPYIVDSDTKCILYHFFTEFLFYVANKKWKKFYDKIRGAGTMHLPLPTPVSPALGGAHTARGGGEWCGYPIDLPRRSFFSTISYP